MAGYQYKTVAAPRRLKKVKGVKGKDALLAHTVEELIAVEAAQGWEYQRTDTFPVEEKGGMFSKAVTTYRAVLIFRRALPSQTYQQPAAAPQAAPAPRQTAQPAPQPAPAQPQRAEPNLAGAAPHTPRVGGAND